MATPTRAPLPPANCSVAGGSSGPIFGIETISIFVAPPRSSSAPEGHGEIAFGAMQATLDVEFGRSSVAFAWTGFDEGDEIPEKDPPNFSMTASLRSTSSITTATMPSSKRSESLFQQPATRNRTHLDFDRQGLPGSPDRARAILAKIDSSSVFIGDVISVGEITCAD